LPHIATGAIDNDIFCQPIDNDWYSDDIELDTSSDNHKIAAMQRNQRQRPFCQCCMTSGHNADHCFLQGKHFQPDALNKQINVYNQQNGDKPPKSVEIKPWDPQSLPPIISYKQLINHQNNNKKKKSKSINPFTNAESKSNGPSANALVTDIDNPSISSFIQNQDDKIVIFLDNNDNTDGDSDDNSAIIATFHLPTITTILSTSSRISTELQDIQHPFSTTTIISNFTPHSIQHHMKKVHQHINHPL
jgi:hypothetical protein